LLDHLLHRVVVALGDTVESDQRVEQSAVDLVVGDELRDLGENAVVKDHVAGLVEAGEPAPAGDLGAEKEPPAQHFRVDVVAQAGCGNAALDFVFGVFGIPVGNAERAVGRVRPQEAPAGAHLDHVDDQQGRLAVAAGGDRHDHLLPDVVAAVQPLPARDLRERPRRVGVQERLRLLGGERRHHVRVVGAALLAPLVVVRLAHGAHAIAARVIFARGLFPTGVIPVHGASLASRPLLRRG
jgi:hypothetical protein